jgi:hypothetical protein
MAWDSMSSSLHYRVELAYQRNIRIQKACQVQEATMSALCAAGEGFVRSGDMRKCVLPAINSAETFALTGSSIPAPALSHTQDVVPKPKRHARNIVVEIYLKSPPHRVISSHSCDEKRAMS